MHFLFTALLTSALSHAAPFKVTSQALKPGATLTPAQVYNSFGCTGENISPDLQWTNAPTGTKTFAITMYDPDAPTGSGWWHWTLINIPASVRQIAAGASSPRGELPEGALETRTDFGKPGYGGPCPPPGKPHRYLFKVYALKDSIPLDKEASGAMVGFYANQLKLAEAVIETKFGRK